MNTAKYDSGLLKEKYETINSEFGKYILTGKQPDIKEIEDYYKTEILDTRRQIKHASGFSA